MNTLKNSVFMSLCFGLIVFILPTSEVGADAPQILQGHSSPITMVVYSPDGETLASIAKTRFMRGDNTVKLWDAKTWELKHTFTEHSSFLNSIAYSPDSKTLASTSYDNTVKLWNVTTGELKHTLTGHSDRINAIVYSPDGKTLASASDDTVKLWNVTTGELKSTLIGHSDRINAIAYSPDGKTLASASYDNTVKLWNVKTGELKKTLTGHSNFRYIAYSPDGTILASLSGEKTIKLWNAKTGELKNTLTGSNFTTDIAYSHDGKLLAVAGNDTVIKLWNTETGEIILSLVKRRGRVNTLIFLLSGSKTILASSPTESILASASVDKGKVKLWNTKTGNLIVNLQHSNSVNAITYSPNGQTLVSASGDDLHVWDVSAKTLEQVMFAQLSELPEKFQKIEDNFVSKTLKVKQWIENSIDWRLNQVLSSQDGFTQWFEEFHNLEEAGSIEQLKLLQIPNIMEYNMLVERTRMGIELIQITRSELPTLAKLRERIASVPVLERAFLREEFEALEARLSVKLSGLESFPGFLVASLNPEDGAPFTIPESESQTASHSPPKAQEQEIPITHITQPLPHNGLFIRRNNAFGTQPTTSIKELINEGVMIGQKHIRFDDFVALNTEGIPSPKSRQALAVSYGIVPIPAHQKRDKRATHYLEIALKTADVAPIGHPEAKAPPVNYIFVVDVSDSMSGTKIDHVRYSINELFGQLRADDVIGTIVFNHHAKTLLESTPKQNLSDDEFELMIDQLLADGGTDINQALSISIDEMRRYRGAQRVNQLFLFSDGNPTSGETDWIKIRQNIANKLRQNTATDGTIRLSTFAFGHDDANNVVDANKVELERLAGLTGGQSILVMNPKEDIDIIRRGLQQALARRTHLAAINMQMQIEIDSDIDILHFYGHDLITDKAARAAVEREADLTGKQVEEEYGVKPQPDLIKEDKGIRVFVPNLAVGETYWVVFELAVPEQRKSSAFGKATVQYFDTFARQNQRPQLALSPTGQIGPQFVAQYALGLWTSEEVSYALHDIEVNELATAEKRIKAHISVLETAKSHLMPKTFSASSNPVNNLLVDDIITLNKFLTLAKNINQGTSAENIRLYLNHGLRELEGTRNGVRRTRYGRE
jgi:WD40 repeat protein/Mg-chelatase subunit ChlD